MRRRLTTKDLLAAVGLPPLPAALAARLRREAAADCADRPETPVLSAREIVARIPGARLELDRDASR